MPFTADKAKSGAFSPTVGGPPASSGSAVANMKQDIKAEVKVFLAFKGDGSRRSASLFLFSPSQSILDRLQAAEQLHTAQLAVASATPPIDSGAAPSVRSTSLPSLDSSLTKCQLCGKSMHIGDYPFCPHAPSERLISSDSASGNSTHSSLRRAGPFFEETIYDHVSNPNYG
ncbi:MAG: hypothetical protein JOY85_19275 [Acidobacteriaceae bacterium]|nr:hypothetical protein [Acidobacteriaceae bacterium]